MAKQYTLRRSIGNVQIVAGSFATLDMPRDYDYQAIMLRISASVTVTAPATSVRAEAPCQLVPRVEFIADGKNTIDSAPFWFYSLGNVQRQLIATNARAVTPPSGTAAATYAVEGIAVIDKQFFRGVRPKDSNFRSMGLSLLQLRLTFGQPGDIFVGGTVTFSGTPVVEVVALQEVEETDQNGKPVTNPIALKKVSYQQVALTASNANQQILLPAGNNIGEVFCRFDGATTAGEPSTAVLNAFQAVNGVDVRANLSGAQLRAMNNATYGYITPGYYSWSPLACGWGGNWKLSDLWDVTNASQPKAVLDVTGGANVTANVVTTEYILAQG